MRTRLAGLHDAGGAAGAARHRRRGLATCRATGRCTRARARSSTTSRATTTTGGSARRAAPTAATPTGSKGLFGVGSALRFDGNDYISIPDDKSLHPQRLTVEAWAKRDGSPGQFKYIVSKGGDNCEAASYGLYSSHQRRRSPSTSTTARSGTARPQASQKIWDGQWHHIAGTYDGKKVRLFVDGSEVGNGTPSAARSSTSQPIGEGAIGAYRGSCKLTLSGTVDEVRIWTVALPDQGDLGR